MEIYYEALKTGKYTSFLSENSALPMMYMPDCLKATLVRWQARTIGDSSAGLAVADSLKFVIFCGCLIDVGVAYVTECWDSPARFVCCRSRH